MGPRGLPKELRCTRKIQRCSANINTAPFWQTRSIVGDGVYMQPMKVHIYPIYVVLYLLSIKHCQLNRSAQKLPKLKIQDRQWAIQNNWAVSMFPRLPVMRVTPLGLSQPPPFDIEATQHLPLVYKQNTWSFWKSSRIPKGSCLATHLLHGSTQPWAPTLASQKVGKNSFAAGRIAETWARIGKVQGAFKIGEKKCSSKIAECGKPESSCQGENSVEESDAE